MLSSEGLGFCLAFRRLFLLYYIWMFIYFHRFNGFLSTFPYIDYYFCGLGIKHLSHFLLSISYRWIMQFPRFLVFNCEGRNIKANQRHQIETITTRSTLSVSLLQPLKSTARVVVQEFFGHSNSVGDVFVRFLFLFFSAFLLTAQLE